MSKYVFAKYIRLSVDDGITESLSIQNQRLILDKHIDGLEIPNAEILEFVDNGHSGVNMERPEVQKLIDLVHSGGVNCVCVKDFSRFSRNVMDSGYFIEQVFPLYGVRFISVSDCFDSDDYKNDTGGIDVAFKFLMHEYYSKDLSNKVKSAMRVKMRNGEYFCKRRIYGYERTDDRRQIPNEPAASVVRRIFALALSGKSTSVIRDILASERIPTPSQYIAAQLNAKTWQSDTWTARMVLTILNNVQYAGCYVAGKQEQKAVGSHSVVWVDKSEWIVIPDSHTPIVSKEVFAAVQNMLAERLKGATTAKPVRNVLVEDENRKKRKGMLSGERLPNNVIYGYAKTPDGDLVIDEAVAVVIREIYGFARQGLSADEIKAKMIDAKHPVPSEYLKLAKGQLITPTCQWTVKCVRNLLKNIQYTGAYVSGKILKNYESGKKYHTAESDWVIIPGKYPAIVSLELYDEVQVVTTESRHKRKNVRPKDYLLRGDILKCGCCRYALRYDPIADPVFRCWHTQAAPNADCHKMKVNVRELDEAVLTIIRKQAEVVLNAGSLANLRQKSDAENLASDYEKLITEHNERRQRLYERFVLREIDRAEYLRLKDECSAEIDRLNKQIAAAKAEARAKDMEASTLAFAQKTVSGAIPHKKLVETLIDKIYVFPDKRIEIVWKIADFTNNISMEGRRNV
jgi:DNA invertase Pin-like site-specific DNA recombinase